MKKYKTKIRTHIYTPARDLGYIYESCFIDYRPNSLLKVYGLKIGLEPTIQLNCRKASFSILLNMRPVSTNSVSPFPFNVKFKYEK